MGSNWQIPMRYCDFSVCTVTEKLIFRTLYISLYASLYTSTESNLVKANKTDALSVQRHVKRLHMHLKFAALLSSIKPCSSNEVPQWWRCWNTEVNQHMGGVAFCGTQITHRHHIFVKYIGTTGQWRHLNLNKVCHGQREGRRAP